MKATIMRLTALVLLLAVLAGLLHHYAVCGRWFDWIALAHHEPFILLAIWTSLLLLINSFLHR